MRFVLTCAVYKTFESSARGLVVLQVVLKYMTRLGDKSHVHLHGYLLIGVVSVSSTFGLALVLDL